jgi:hypothetical protein
METYCSPNIDYSNLSEIIRKQKEGLKNTIEKYLQVKTVNKYLELEKVVKKFKKDVQYNYLK